MVFATKKTGRPKTGIGEPIQVRLKGELLAALDVWIAERAADIAAPEILSRPEALRRLAAEALIGMGLLKP